MSTTAWIILGVDAFLVYVAVGMLLATCWGNHDDEDSGR